MWACCEWEFTAPPTDGGSILWHAAVFLQELGKKSHLITGGGLIQAIWTATDAFQLRRSIPQSTTALFWIAEVSCRSHFQIRSCLFACAPKGTNRMSLDHCWTFMVATECWKSCPSSCTKPKVSVCSSAALWFRKAVNASGLDNWPWVSQFYSQSQELIEFLDYKYWISRPPQNSSWDSFSTSGQHFCVFQVLFVLREAWGTKSVPWGIHCGSCWSSSCQLLTEASHFCVLQFEQLRPILSLKLDQGFIYLGKC